MKHSVNSFASMDHSDALDAFSPRHGKALDDIDAYTLRKRKMELYALVRRIIRDELTPEQQEIVRLHWYEEKNLNEIAAIMNMDKSTISRKEKKINEIIFDKVKYALEYRYGKSFSNSSTVIIKNNRRACFPCDGKSISARLRNLRLRQSLELNELAIASGIKTSRLEDIEKEGEKITAEEISKLSRLFGTTSDYIVFGISKPQ